MSPPASRTPPAARCARFPPLRPLFLNRSRDEAGNPQNLVNRADNPLDCRHRFLDQKLDLYNLLADFLRRFRRLPSQAFHFRSNPPNPLPVSPARAASMVAFSTSKLRPMAFPARPAWGLRILRIPARSAAYRQIHDPGHVPFRPHPPSGYKYRTDSRRSKNIASQYRKQRRE